MDYKLELMIVPVSDVDRAKAFYVDAAGFRLDVDHRAGDAFRVVQVTPPGSACSVSFGVGISNGEPGSVKGLHLVVTDIEEAHEELTGRGIDVGEIHHFTEQGRTPGLDPGRTDYNSFATFTDPDGNAWVLQEVRHPTPRG
jgi:catechol 2,3-dioxygenase-like lactoylglutathione lyase family enzyme